MNKTLLFALCILCGTAYAQSPESILERYLADKGIVLFPPGTQSPATLQAAKTAGTGSRLIQAFRGITTTGASANPWDSVTYDYNNGRGGDLNSNPYIPYDVRNTYTTDSVTGAYRLTRIDTQLHNGANMRTSNVTSLYNGSGFQYNRRELYSYNSSGQLSTVVTQYWHPGTGWVNAMKDSINYSASGDTASFYQEQWNTGAWARYSRRLITHNTSGQRTSITYGYYQSGAWKEYMRYLFTYNSTGQLSSRMYETSMTPGVWVPNTEYRNYYNSAGFIIASSSFAWYAATPYVSDSVAITYSTGSVPLVQDITTYERINTVMQPWYHFTPGYTTTGLVASMQQDYWNTSSASFVPNNRELYFYNSFDQLVNAYYQQPSGSGWVPSVGRMESRYYYSTFNTGITAASPTALAFSAYPNPAHYKLNIQLQLEQPAELCIRLTDVMGKLVYSGTEWASGSYNSSLPISQLPSGTYYLSVSTSKKSGVQVISVQH